MANRKVAILASGGGRDTAYKVFNIATVAAAMGAEVAIFFTFEGVKLIHKQLYGTLPLPPAMEGLQDSFTAHNVPPVPELVAMAQDMGVTFTACQLTLDIMSAAKEDLVEGVEVAGAAAFLVDAYDADVTLTF